MKFIHIFLFMFIFLALSGEDIPFFDRKPVIDGKISSKEWSNALKFKLQGAEGQKAPEQTDVYIAYDTEFLYIAFECFEENMENIKLSHYNQEARDVAVWQDDCVEIFIDPFNSGKEDFYQIVINSAGIIFDAANGDKSWDGDIKRAVRLHNKSWVVEVAVPFDDLPYAPKGAELWNFNFAREKKQPSGNSCLNPGPPGLNSIKHFSPLKFSDKDTAFSLKSLKYDGRNIALIEFAKSSPAEYEVEISGRTGEKTTVKALPGDCIKAAYKLGAKSKIMQLTISQKGENKKILYNNVINFSIPKNKVNKGKTKESTLKNPSNSLYKELWSDRGPGLVKDGAIYWFHHAYPLRLRLMALQYGIRYVYDEMGKLCADDKLMPLGTYGQIKRWSQYTDKYGVKNIYFPDYRMTKAPKDGKTPFIADPRCEKAFIDDLERIKEFKGKLWGVFFGDERSRIAEKTAIVLFEKEKNTYPYIRQVDAEVKKNYGNGVYGMPTSLTDQNPYRWIAFRHWLNDKLINLMKKTYDTTKRIDPDLYVISDDPIGAPNRLYDFSQFKGVCDIITHQASPGISGFVTKYVRDLSSCEEVWPCPHVEEYLVSYTPEEVLDELSKIVLNGATGFKYYLADTVGRRARKKCLFSEYFGAPERWRVEMNVLKEMGKMNRLKFPVPDCAVFAPVDTLRAYYGRNNFPHRENVLYSFLGPNAGVWFKYINESLLDELKNYKLVFVADAKYLRQTALDKLKDFVRKGGTLVVVDPQAFSFTPHGRSLAAERLDLFGISSTGKAKHMELLYAKQNLNVVGLRCVDLKLRKGTEVIAAFENGTPGIIRNPVGKGSVWYFAVDTLTPKMKIDKDWKSFFKEFAGRLGLKCDNAIWRFRFPARLLETIPVPQTGCLSANSVVWRQFKPIVSANLNTGGTYSYSEVPDYIDDQGGVRNIPFAKGDLTDRVHAPAAGDVSGGIGKINDWIVSWKKNKTIAIDFDFKKTYEIEKIIVFYQHFIRDVKIELSPDKKKWETFSFPATRKDNEFPDDIRERVYKLPDAQKARYLRLKWAKASGEKNIQMTIAELEVWGKYQKGSR
jgi:hypothetical protein